MAQALQFDQSGVFRILQLTDLHYEDGGKADQKMLRVVNDLLGWEQPHLVVLTGDFNTNARSEHTMAEALRPIIDAGVPFCYVFGNHDPEYGARHPALVRALSALPGCINPPSAQGVPGYSNFVLKVGGSQASWLLVGLDSGMYNEDPRVGGYDYIKPAQTAWAVQQLQNHAAVNQHYGALCFLHIPLPEYESAFNQGRVIGSKLEDVCCPEQNSGLFSALLSQGHTQGIFAGHDHLNDYCADLHGIALCYGRAGGYSTYGRSGFRKGGRMILLRKTQVDSFETWIRLSDGSIKDHVALSALRS